MEFLIPLVIGVILAFIFAKFAYKKESTKLRKISGAFLAAIIGFFTPLIITAFIMAPEQEPKTKEELVMSRLSNSLDGCQLDMKREVKKLMNDPDSFKCIETNIIKRKNDYVLIMTFQGKNQFGGVVKNVAKAEYNSDGKFVRLVD